MTYIQRVALKRQGRSRYALHHGEQGAKGSGEIPSGLPLLGRQLGKLSYAGQVGASNLAPTTNVSSVAEFWFG